jgi:hypothetical protein
MQQEIKDLQDDVRKLKERVDELEKKLTGHEQLRGHKTEPVPVEPRRPAEGPPRSAKAADAGITPPKDAKTPIRGSLHPGKGAGARDPGSLEPPKGR